MHRIFNLNRGKEGCNYLEGILDFQNNAKHLVYTQVTNLVYVQCVWVCSVVPSLICHLVTVTLLYSISDCRPLLTVKMPK